MSSLSSGCVCVEAPDEIAAVLLRDRLAPQFRCEIERLDSGGWQLQVHASGQVAVAAVLASTREWLAAERIAATTLTVDGLAQVLEGRLER